MRCSPTVNFDRLKPFFERAGAQPGPRPVADPGPRQEGEREEELLLNRRRVRGVPCYLVRWRRHVRRQRVAAQGGAGPLPRQGGGVRFRRPPSPSCGSSGSPPLAAAATSCRGGSPTRRRASRPATPGGISDPRPATPSDSGCPARPGPGVYQRRVRPGNLSNVGLTSEPGSRRVALRVSPGYGFRVAASEWPVLHRLSTYKRSRLKGRATVTTATSRC